MACTRIVAALLCLLLGVVLATPIPDSAGIVEMIPGIAYGGIPYGSVSGMLKNYAPAQAYYPYNGVQPASLAGSVLLPAGAGLPVNSVSY